MAQITGSDFRTTGVPIPDALTSGSEFTVGLEEGPGYLTIETVRNVDGFYDGAPSFSSISASNTVSTVFGPHIISTYMGNTTSGSLSFIPARDIPANQLLVKIASSVQDIKVFTGGGADPAFKMTIDTTKAGSASDTFVLPLASGTTYDFDIDWGDGNSETITTSTNVTHVYPSAGEYQIAITGDFPRIFFNNTGDRLKLMSIDNFGDIVWGSDLSEAWNNCSNLVINASDVGNFGNVTNFTRAWQNCSSLTSFPQIDTSSGTNFINTWRLCSSLTSFPLLDTSSGTNLSSTWNLCSNLASFPANAFDTNIATNYGNAFGSTALLTQSIDDILVSLDTSGVSNGTFTQSGGQAPSATGEAAIDSLVGKGWTVTVTGGYQPILFPNWEDNNIDGSVFMTALNDYVPQTFNNTIDTFGSLSGTEKWAGGVLAPNGKIYGIPLNSTQVLEIDPETNTTTLFGSFSGSLKWVGGVLAPNGKIYAIPFNSTQVLEIDPETQTTTLFGSLSGNNKWVGGVLAPNGKIYGIPNVSTQVLEIDPDTNTATLFGSLSGTDKWAGGVLAPNGKIYGIPLNATQVLEIDPATNTTTLFGSLSGTAKWFGGVLAPNSKIYGIPFNSTQILEIDPETQTTTLFGSLSGSLKWYNGVLASNGKIYSIPLNATQVLEIDPITNTTNLFGSLGSGSSKWRGAVLTTNGKIYGISASSTTILTIGDTNAQDEDFVLSRYVNKL